MQWPPVPGSLGGVLAILVLIVTLIVLVAVVIGIGASPPVWLVFLLLAMLALARLT
jgi:hypothetical protein